MSLIPTNCGMLDLASTAFKMLNDFTSNHTDIAGSPDLTRNRITYFHNTVCQWAYNIPLKSDWVMVIHAKSPNHRQHLLGEISRISDGNREARGWEMSQSATATFNPAVQDVIGCIFAQAVDLPGETITHTHAGISSGFNRGFINAPIITGRSNFELLEIAFLETHRSFVDSFLRPWSILVGHRGLIADTSPAKGIKADIYVHQLARIGTDRDSAIRKTFVFEDCAPLTISSEKLEYGVPGDFPKMQVKFSYNRYYIKDS